MSNLHITERKYNTEGLGCAYPIEGPFVANQIKAIGAGVQTSAAMSEGTEYVSLYAEAACMIAISSTPTGTIGEYLGAGERIQRDVKPTDTISVIAAA